MEVSKKDEGVETFSCSGLIQPGGGGWWWKRGVEDNQRYELGLEMLRGLWPGGVVMDTISISTRQLRTGGFMTMRRYWEAKVGGTANSDVRW
ncbi:hypothetical protein GQ43DRAFT_73366 [Delitschia confertaspora ATCC 74209]|uniref:Uncharacterized protein n=1 Tax=Delitschia confertaspora ATCC 74209 TaxID=1513339 RepID=A0A9P4MRZ5_9PLEO|nr:hypothetical protein GQ43DRAFT_73366 [Delitschia confertaspora ATCC 74209]